MRGGTRNSHHCSKSGRTPSGDSAATPRSSAWGAVPNRIVAGPGSPARDNFTARPRNSGAPVGSQQVPVTAEAGSASSTWVTRAIGLRVTHAGRLVCQLPQIGQLFVGRAGCQRKRLRPSTGDDPQLPAAAHHVNESPDDSQRQCLLNARRLLKAAQA